MMDGDSEKEVLLSDSDPTTPVTSTHPIISHVTPAFIARPEVLPCSQPLHSTPIIETFAPTLSVEHGVALQPQDVPTKQSPTHQKIEMEKRENDRDRFHLEPDRYESRHASISHSLSGGGVNLSLPHSGSRHSLASRSVMVSQEKKEEKKERERRKEARKAKSAQLPAHGEVQKMEHSLLKLLNEFNSGQLRAFDSVYSLEQMESVRNQQEAIARKHFELGAAQDLHPPLSDEGLAMAGENMERLMGSLEELSLAIGQLSCLDRMVDRGGRNMDMVETNNRRDSEFLEGSQVNFSQPDEKPLIISRRSTMSNVTESTQLVMSNTADSSQLLESDVDYVERISQRTFV